MITITKLTKTDALYHRYQGFGQPQKCFVELDCENKELFADWDAEVGGAVPVPVMVGKRRRYAIPCLTADSANELLHEIVPLAERVIKGYSHGYGSDGNKKAYAELDEDATKAEEEIIRLCEDANYTKKSLIVWYASDYFADNPPEVTPDTNLNALKEEILKNELGSDVHVIDYLDEYLKDLKEQASEED